jgi:hypothetical protein
LFLGNRLPVTKQRSSAALAAVSSALAGLLSQALNIIVDTAASRAIKTGVLVEHFENIMVMSLCVNESSESYRITELKIYA